MVYGLGSSWACLDLSPLTHTQLVLPGLIMPIKVAHYGLLETRQLSLRSFQCTTLCPLPPELDAARDTILGTAHPSRFLESHTNLLRRSIVNLGSRRLRGPGDE